MNKNKVIWSEDDIDLLVETTYDLRMNDPEPSLLQIIQIAQEILPESKRRKVSTRGHCVDIIDGVKKKFLENKINTNVFDKMKIIIDERINGLNNKIETLKARMDSLETNKKHSRLKIVLIGFLQGQYETIEELIEDQVELKNVESSKNKNVHLPSGDYCIYSAFTSHEISNRCNIQYGKENCFRVETTNAHTIVNRIKELMIKSRNSS